MANIIGQMILVCLIAIISTSGYPFRDSNSDRINLLKKNYVASEYKRRPDYNFGIGKRDNEFSRIQALRPYSFGFGKRYRLANEYTQQSSGKRTGIASRYNFGLGKRAIPDYDASSTNEDPEYFAGHRTSLSNEDPNYRFVFGPSNDFVDDQDDVHQID